MAGRIRKLIGAVLLIAAIIVTQIPAENVSASNADFKCNGSVLVKYSGIDSSIKIPDGVTVIGEEAFAGNDSVESIQLGDQVTEIRYRAFADCSKLRKIEIPDSVTEIGNGAFSGCDALAGGSLGSGVTKLGSGVFAGSDSLNSITISKDNTAFSCEGGVIYNADQTKLIEMLGGCKTTVYEMPDTITDVEKYAFWGCQNLQTVTLSPKLDGITPYAFSNCKSLRAISLPYSVKRIDAKAFEDCTNLEAIQIPASVSSIHETAFDGCSNLNIAAEEGSYAQEYASTREVSNVTAAEYEDLTGTILANAVVQTDDKNTQTSSDTENSDVSEMSGEGRTEASSTETGDGAVEPYVNPLEISEAGLYGASVVVSNEAVVFIDNSKQTVYQGNQGSTGSGEGTGQGGGDDGDGVAESTSADGNTAELPVDTDTSAEKGISFPKHTIVDKKIANQAYYRKTDLTEYQIDSDITEIGDFAFARSGLTQIEIPEGVTQIGYAAFYHCDQLGSVSIPTTVTEIEPYAFEHTGWLENWKKGNGTDFLIVGDGILLAYRGGDSKISIPEGVRSIAANCFEGHTGIVVVTLPTTLLTIGEEAFFNCSNLATVNGGANLLIIEDRAFSGCPIGTVRIGQNVTSVGLCAYDISGTVRRNSVSTIDFQGSTLPSVGYVETSTRYSNSAYRGFCFEGAEFAVVDQGVTDFDRTVLDASLSGFRGYICYLNDTEDTEGNATATLRRCTVSGTQESDMPVSFTYYGRTCTISAVEEGAFDTNAVSVPASEPVIAITVRSEILTAADVISAVIEGNNDYYKLLIADDPEAETNLLEAYTSIYGGTDGLLLHGFNISMQNAYGIPIQKLGKNTMQITVQVPEGMTADTVYVMCLDADGQLESVPSETIERGGRDCVTFTARHFSEYGIYCYVDQDGTPVKPGQLDDSPDTGDRSPESKWVLCILLAAVASILILWRKPKGNNKCVQ